MIRREDVFKIGRMGKPHGVKGEVSMQCDDDVFDRVDADYLVLDVDGILVPFFIEEYRFRSDDVVLMKLEDIDSEQQARELTGCDVYFPHSLADNGESAEVSWQQLQGFVVLDHQHGDRVVGRVAGVDVSTVNTLLEVEREDGSDVLIPASEDLVVDVDIAGRRIVLDIPDGLLDL